MGGDAQHALQPRQVAADEDLAGKVLAENAQLSGADYLRYGLRGREAAGKREKQVARCSLDKHMFDVRVEHSSEQKNFRANIGREQ